MTAPKEINRWVRGVYVNPDAYRNHTFRYAHLVYEVAYDDGSSQLENGKPLYEHESGGPTWPMALRLLVLAWEIAMPLLKAHEEKKR